MKSQPAPDWAVDMAKVPFNPMEERAAFAFATGGPRSAIPSAAAPPPPPQMPSHVEPRSLQVPGVALLDAQFDFLDAKEKVERAAVATQAKAQDEAYRKFMEQAAKWDEWFAKFQKALLR
jgi:hypothetical protein